MAASRGQGHVAAKPNDKGRNPGDDMEEDDFELPAEFGQGELVAVSTGFPPYLVIEEGVKFACTVESLDLTDPDFIRFVCKNLGKELKCNTGKRNDGQEVIVNRGEEFTVSWFATLPLEWAMSHKTPLLITPLAKESGRKMANGKPGNLWRFSYETTADGAKQIAAEKNRALGFGRRMIVVGTGNQAESQPNPSYLGAFTDGNVTELLAGRGKNSHTANAEA